MALTDRLKSAREQLATALQAMDYEQALTFQVEVDELQDEIVHRLIKLSKSGQQEPKRSRLGTAPRP
jgi:hypothetical protein